jgi:Domain of unknown function (DUF3786)
MPRIEDYNQALILVRDQLSQRDPSLVARFSGAELVQGNDGLSALRFSFLNQEVRVSWPELKVLAGSTGDEMPIQQQILLLHYLHGAWASQGPKPTGEWISFQEIPDGRFYLDAFHRRAKNPLVQSFGEKPELLVMLAKQLYRAQSSNQGDASVLVQAFPLLTVTLILWKGDEDFPPEGNILFDSNIIEILSAEDVAWLSGMVVYPLIGMAKHAS